MVDDSRLDLMRHMEAKLDREAKGWLDQPEENHSVLVRLPILYATVCAYVARFLQCIFIYLGRSALSTWFLSSRGFRRLAHRTSRPSIVFRLPAITMFNPLLSLACLSDIPFIGIFLTVQAQILIQCGSKDIDPYRTFTHVRL